MFLDIKSLLPKSLNRSGLGQQIKMAQIIEIFEHIADQVIPADLRSSVQAVYYKNKVLSVASLSFIAQQELRRREDVFIKKINQDMGEEVVCKFTYLA
jgi:hypothetical protein